MCILGGKGLIKKPTFADRTKKGIHPVPSLSHLSFHLSHQGQRGVEHTVPLARE